MVEADAHERRHGAFGESEGLGQLDRGRGRVGIELLSRIGDAADARLRIRVELGSRPGHAQDGDDRPAIEFSHGRADHQFR